MTRKAGASNLQVRNWIRPSLQVARSAPRTLSRWRHGFEPRWDYKSKMPGQGTSPEAISSLNRDSNTEYPANIPRRIKRRGTRTPNAENTWDLLLHVDFDPWPAWTWREGPVRLAPVDVGNRLNRWLRVRRRSPERPDAPYD
jgi:hypothetical protein